MPATPIHDDHLIIPTLRQLASGQQPQQTAQHQTLQHLQSDYGAVVLDESQQWQLAYPIEWLRAADFAGVFSLPCVVSICDHTPSTNTMLKESGEPPSILLTEHQHGGKGQRGKQWLSLPASGIAMSACFATPKAMSSLSGLSVALGAALCQAFATLAPLRFKFPNDIITASDEKVAGILIEVNPHKTIIGVGCNWQMTEVLAARIAQLGQQAAGLLSQLAAPLTRTQCAQLIGQTLCATMTQFCDAGFAAFQKIAQQFHHVGIGETWTDGRFAHQQFCGFADDGALITSEAGRVVN